MDVFTALAEPTRRTIIETLAERGRAFGDGIADKFDSSPPSTAAPQSAPRGEADTYGEAVAPEDLSVERGWHRTRLTSGCGRQKSCGTVALIVWTK